MAVTKTAPLTVEQLDAELSKLSIEGYWNTIGVSPPEPTGHRHGLSFSENESAPADLNGAKPACTDVELSPRSHPPMRRVLAAFEPCWLGGATGRGAEPSM